MRRQILTTMLIVIIASSAFCQVDTLMLVEVNSFEVSGEITQIYTESIRDNYKEIYICTNDHIYVYDSQTNELIWSRGELINPQDLLFEDINNDGFKDLAFRDSLNIFLYDVINSDLIWTSPVLDSTYKCYTVGDYNDDGWIDAAIVTKEPFTRSGDDANLDTVWVDLYDGPFFNTYFQFTILMPNSWYYLVSCNYFSNLEYPIKIIINKLSGTNNLFTKIIIFSKIQVYHDEPEGNYSGGTSGRAWIINVEDFEITNVFICGQHLHNYTLNHGDLTYLHVLSFLDSYSQFFEDYYYSNSNTLKSFSSDTTIGDRNIWLNNNSTNTIYQGFTLNDINENENGYEFCFGYYDSLYQMSLPSYDTIWTNNSIPGFIIKDIYHSNIYFPNTQILFENNSHEYKFCSGTDGNITALLSNQNIAIEHISDLNSDNNDELLSIDGSTLHIYNLEYYVGIDNPTAVPRSTFLKANYPNPFNSSTIIKYALNREQQVTLEIYDLLGRHVETLVDDYQAAGLHQAVWNAENVSSGVYFYKLIAGDFVKAKKMLMLK